MLRTFLATTSAPSLRSIVLPRDLLILAVTAFDDKIGDSGIEADCQPIENHFPDGIAHSREIVREVRDLIVSDEKGAIVFVLQPDPVGERACVVPEVQRTGWTDPGKNASTADHGRSQYHSGGRPGILQQPECRHTGHRIHAHEYKTTPTTIAASRMTHPMHAT